MRAHLDSSHGRLTVTTDDFLRKMTAEVVEDSPEQTDIVVTGHMTDGAPADALFTVLWQTVAEDTFTVPASDACIHGAHELSPPEIEGLNMTIERERGQ